MSGVERGLHFPEQLLVAYLSTEKWHGFEILMAKTLRSAVVNLGNWRIVHAVLRKRVLARRSIQCSRGGSSQENLVVIRTLINVGQLSERKAWVKRDRCTVLNKNEVILRKHSSAFWFLSERRKSVNQLSFFQDWRKTASFSLSKICNRIPSTFEKSGTSHDTAGLEQPVASVLLSLPDYFVDSVTLAR